VTVRAELKPKGPYSLRLSGRMASDATRVVTDGGRCQRSLSGWPGRPGQTSVAIAADP